MNRLLFGAIVMIASAAGFAAEPTYTALRGARPDGRTIAVNNLTFDRDVYHVTLNGTLHLLAPVEGKTVGAVFLGRGSYDLTPATEIERRTLALNADVKDLKTLHDDFETMVVFDADLLEAAGTSTAGTPSPEATSAFDRFLRFERNDLTTNLHLRVLQAMLNGEPSFPFIAWAAGKKTSAVLAVDRRGAESLRLFPGDLASEETILLSADKQRGGFWYSSHLRGEAPHAIEALARATHYTVETTFKAKDEIAGVTTIEIVNGPQPLRLLPISLLSQLRIDEASVTAGDGAASPLAFIQEAAKEDGDAAVVFPKALDPGQKATLRIAYHGREVLQNAGDGNFYVGARASWYPNIGTFTALAPFDLTYRMPSAYHVVSVGEPVADRIEGTDRIATFKTAQPIRVAGFNYGKFRKIVKSDPQSGMTVEVFTNTGTPDIIRDINRALEHARDSAQNQNLFNPGSTAMYTGPDHISLDTNGLADGAIVDGFNTARVGKAFFGPLPMKRVAVTQQSQWAFGQSWPQLIYMPYLAVLSSTMRVELGINDLNQFVNEVGPHEFSHQYWGHTVSPATYHDAWLSEGFAEFSVALVLQVTGGMGKYNDFWERSRKSITGTPTGALATNIEAGPLSQGWRLSTWRNRGAYQAQVYGKGAYILQMLRMLMQDTRNNPADAQFIAAMTEFVQTYAGKNATTEDFKHVLEHHMMPSLNGAGNGKLDWFFDQWVYGTDIPRLTSTLKAENGSEGKVRLSGNITQAEVSDGFKTLVPVYAEFDKGQLVRLAVVPMTGNSTRPLDVEIPMPKKPRVILINAMHEVLSK